MQTGKAPSWALSLSHTHASTRKLLSSLFSQLLWIDLTTNVKRNKTTSLEAKGMHEELNKLLFVVVCAWSRFEKKVFACLYANTQIISQIAQEVRTDELGINGVSSFRKQVN